MEFERSQLYQEEYRYLALNLGLHHLYGVKKVCC